MTFTEKYKHLFQMYEAICPKVIWQHLVSRDYKLHFFLLKLGPDSSVIAPINEKLSRSATFQHHVRKCCFSAAVIDLTMVITPQSPIRAQWLESVFLAVGCPLFAAPFLLTWFGMWQNNLAGKLVEFRKIKVLQWDISRPSEVDMLFCVEKWEESLGADQAGLKLHNPEESA